MDCLKEILVILRDLVTVIALPLLLYRVWIMKSTFEQDHTRSRNSKAVDLIKDWTKSLNSKSSVARKFVEKFDEETCKKLNKQERLQIDYCKENKKFFYSLFGEKKLVRKHGKIILDSNLVSLLRWEIIMYLNALEGVLVAYRHNVANQKIIKEQFLYLVSPEEDHYILEKFRKASGIDNYPGIRDFVNELKLDKAKILTGEGKTGKLTT